MKKTLALLLALAVLVLLCACGPQQAEQTDGAESTGEQTAQTGGFRVGYSKVCITPQEDVPLGGYGNTERRISNGFYDDLYATCVAMTDENDNTVLLYALDLGHSYPPVAAARAAVSAATGVPVENVLCSASHTHSGPDLNNTNFTSIINYSTQLSQWLTEAAQEALEDRKTARMYINTVQTEGLNFVRRYVLENGETAGDNYGDFNASAIAGHESEADTSMQLLKFVRDGGKDVIMANFQVHPHRAGGGTKLDISADLVGAFRSKMEESLDCGFIYFTGGAGNINPTSRITEENIYSDYKEHGEALADYAIEANDGYKEVATGNVQAAMRTTTLEIYHETDGLASIAMQIQSVWAETNSYSRCAEMGKPYGINGPYAAKGIVNRLGMGDTQELDIYAFSVGDVAFITAPYEMFDSNGMQIKEGSPYEMTMILTCANEALGYIPSKLGWQNGGYSVDITRFVEGTAENLVGQYLSLLEEMYPTK